MLPSEAGFESALSDSQADAERDRLTSALDALEMLVMEDVDSAEVRAHALEESARSLGLTDLTQRARLVLADVLGRRGETALAAAIERDVLAWAMEQGNDY